MKKKIPAGKKGAGLRALKSKAPEVAKRMGYKKGGLYANIHAKRKRIAAGSGESMSCLLYTSPSPRDGLLSRMPSSA